MKSSRTLHSLFLIGVALLAFPTMSWATPKVGNASLKGDRYNDLRRAQRCMDLTYIIFKGINESTARSGYFDHLQTPVPTSEQNKLIPAEGKSKRLDKKYVGLKYKPSYRASGWQYADLFGQSSSQFKGEIYRRFGSPSNAKPGTYNLSFIVMSDNDQVYVCVLGTEPELFPKGKPKGNTMNNLAARPVVNKSFDNSALVHQGWSTVAAHYHKILKPILVRHGIARKKLILTGHSQGGVLAGYMGFLMAKHRILPSRFNHRLITFAAPRYGTSSFLKRFGTVLRYKAPHMTVDSLETVGDAVPGSWPFGSLPVGKVWRGLPKDVGYKSEWVARTNLIGHHHIAISSYQIKKIIQTKGGYVGPRAVVDTVTSTTSTAAKSLNATCPKGFRKTAVNCVATSCPRGTQLYKGQCRSICPPNTKRSATGAHCITSKRKVIKRTKKVWVGNFKKQSAYKRACPSGMRYSHDLGGYAHCFSGACPASHPLNRGDMCYVRCGSLKTDNFGNCIVNSKAPHTIPHQCPRGYKRKGPLCVK